MLEQPTVRGIVCRFCGTSLVDGLFGRDTPAVAAPRPALRLERASLTCARVVSAQSAGFLRLVLGLIDLLFQEAVDGLAVVDSFAWQAGLAPRRIPPDLSRFAHLGPFARHGVLSLVAQLLTDVPPSRDGVTDDRPWRRVLARLAPERRPALVARLSGWPAPVRRRAKREMTHLGWGSRFVGGERRLSPFSCVTATSTE